ncbi:HAD-IIIC family phosphatase [Thalassomonas actiniarum]|uniref:HAD-IIIC family phosphatase n=1 Tax=Thalassomonas actiniarum TaxID=485447 RepID=A0AAE9YZR3_9GAMM|nr:HAD-IIIC family phosphatase [Thalassomonas actiniarum]WDE02528.1 HAD-IIIC family phosphatase [Thalassomonas actiniarum]
MNMEQASALEEEQRQRMVKCVVWDLDNTLWDGTLLEGGIKGLRPGVLTLIKTLDQRGILQSIASKNEHRLALEQLQSLGIAEYFLCPQINWGAKSASIGRIAKTLNIGLDTFAFIDDQAFEREEVAFALPQVLCVDANELDSLAARAEFIPRFITQDSARRRQMYMADIKRNAVEEHFEGAQDSFLASLKMKLRISHACEADLKRAEELTLRTNQLNTTGYTYSYDELNAFRQSECHHLLVASLEDKYGTYGKIGLVLIALEQDVWVIKLLLMSCRVMTRGVGTVLINHLRNQAREQGVRLLAEMLPNDRNRMMYMTYKFNHFSELEKQGRLVIFENDLSITHDFPAYLIPEIGE